MDSTQDRFGCAKGYQIKVSLGHYVDLVLTHSDTIDLVTISRALSKMCRFGGHTPHFYSVAEHSVIAAQLAEQDGCEREVVAAVLMHDAAEAYLGDVVRPLKLLLTDYGLIEHRMSRTIDRKYNLDFATHAFAIQHYDRVALKLEKRTMWPDDQTQWEGFDAVPDTPAVLHYWTPPHAEYHFLNACQRYGLPVEPEWLQVAAMYAVEPSARDPLTTPFLPNTANTNHDQPT